MSNDRCRDCKAPMTVICVEAPGNGGDEPRKFQPARFYIRRSAVSFDEVELLTCPKCRKVTAAKTYRTVYME